MSITLHHVIRFTGRISWEGRANDLPEKVYGFLFFQAYDRKVFANEIENQMARYMADGGMNCQTVQGDIIDMDRVPQDRMFVPMHWIVNIRPEVIHLSHELSLPDDDKVERLSDGSEPIKQ